MNTEIDRIANTLTPTTRAQVVAFERTLQKCTAHTEWLAAALDELTEAYNDLPEDVRPLVTLPEFPEFENNES